MLLANSDLKDFKLKTLNNVHFCLSILVMPNGYYFGQSELRYRMSANKYVFQDQSGSNGGYILSTFQKEYLQTGYIPTDNDGIQRERPIDFDSP